MLETLTEAMCGISLLLFAMVATLSRTDEMEKNAQTAIALSCLVTAALLWLLWLEGGSLWGSSELLRPLSLVLIVVAIASRMNIKGRNLSFGANPHNIGKMRGEEE